MATKVFTLDTKPGIQRDGTVFDKLFYTDGEWVRFQRGRPRKIGGYRVISDQLTGPSRGIWVNPQNLAVYDASNGEGVGLWDDVAKTIKFEEDDDEIAQFSDEE